MSKHYGPPAAKGTSARGRRRGIVVVLAVVMALGATWGGTLAAGAAPAARDDSSSSGGVLRLPYDLAALGGIKFDPTTPTSPADWYIQQFLYDSLLRQNADGTYSPGLAKSATVVDPQTITVEMQPNAKFSDGTPVDAEAVKYSIERTIAAKNVGAVRAELNEVESITVDSPTKLTIKLKTPIAGQFYNLLANGETYIVSPTAAQSGTPLDQKPVGAGPFVLESFAPESKVVFKKNPNYFQKDKIKLDGIELIQVSGQDPQALPNALLDGIVDAAQVASIAGTEALKGGGLKVDIQPSDSFYTFGSICKNKPPFDNVKVRQALNYATDRDELNQLIYGGASQPMWAHWTEANRLFNPKLDDYYAYNPKKAKKLLKEAGASDLTFDMYANLSTDLERMGEVLKQQWAESGITVNLANTTNIVQDFFTDAKAPASLIPLRRNGLDKVTRNLVPGSIGDICNYDDPKLNAMVQKLRELDAGSKEYQQAWWDMDKYIVENALHLFLIWSPTVNAYNPDTVTKAVYRPDVFGFPRFDLFKMGMKQS